MSESSGFSTLSEEGPEALSFGLIHLLGSAIVTDAEVDGIQVFEGDAGFEESLWLVKPSPACHNSLGNSCGVANRDSPSEQNYPQCCHSGCSAAW